MSDNQRGRPTKLTSETIERVAEAVSIGATYEMAARYADISYDSLNLWRNRGRAIGQAYEEALRQYDTLMAKDKRAHKLPHIAAKDQPFYDFFMALENAKNELAINCLQVVYSAARSDPDWAFRMLTVKFPEDFGGKQKIELSTPSDQPLQIEQHISGEVEVKVPEVDRLASILGILEEVGAFESGALGETGSSADSEAHEVHPDQTKR